SGITGTRHADGVLPSLPGGRPGAGSRVAGKPAGSGRAVEAGYQRSASCRAWPVVEPERAEGPARARAAALATRGRGRPARPVRQASTPNTNHQEISHDRFLRTGLFRPRAARAGADA